MSQITNKSPQKQVLFHAKQIHHGRLKFHQIFTFLPWWILVYEIFVLSKKQKVFHQAQTVQTKQIFTIVGKFSACHIQTIITLDKKLYLIAVYKCGSCYDEKLVSQENLFLCVQL